MKIYLYTESSYDGPVIKVYLSDNHENVLVGYYGVHRKFVLPEISIYFIEKPETGGRYFLPIAGLFIIGEFQ